jgi:hypothetical protein
VGSAFGLSYNKGFITINKPKKQVFAGIKKKKKKEERKRKKGMSCGSNLCLKRERSYK